MTIKQRVLKVIAGLVIAQTMQFPLIPVAIAQHEIATNMTMERAIANSSFEHISVMRGGRRGIPVVVTGYSSTPDQTDDSPFITASGALVGDGVIAANFLPFGTKVQIPVAFGTKIFTVKDRMHRRFSNRVDVWFNDRSSAIKFGIRKAEIVVL